MARTKKVGICLSRDNHVSKLSPAPFPQARYSGAPPASGSSVQNRAAAAAELLADPEFRGHYQRLIDSSNVPDAERPALLDAGAKEIEAQNWERLCQKANDIIGEGEIANDSGREDLKSFAPENAVFNNGADLKTNLSFALNAYNALKVNFHASGLHSTGSEAEDALLGDLDEDQLI